jgi:phage-related protein
MANIVDIIVNATDNASTQIDSVNRALDRLGDGAGKATGVLAGLSGSIAGLAPAVAGVGALASTFATAGIGAVAFGAVAVSSIGGVVEASEEIAKIEEKIANADTTEERIKAKQELATVMGSLSSAEKEAVSGLQEFQGWWGSFTSQFDPQVFGVMTQGLKLVQNTMTALTPAITSVGNVLAGFLEKINNGFESDSAHRFFDYINEVAGSNLQVILTTAGNLFMGFFEILQAFAPLANQFNQGMVGMSEGFLQWSQGLASSQGFQNFVSFVQANTPPLLSLISNLWSFLVQLVSALAPLGSAVLQVASSFAQWLAQSNTVKTGLDMLRSAGEFLLNNLEAVKVVVASVVAGFIAFKVIATIVTMVQTAITIFNALKTAFFAVRTAVMAMNLAFLASPITWIIIGIVALIAIIVLLVKNWDTVKAKALEIWEVIKTAWSGIWSTITQFASQIWSAITTWATNMWTKIQSMWESIKTAFSNGVTATINFFKALPMNIINGIIYLVGFVIGLIIGFWIEMGSAFVKGVQAVVNFFKALPQDISNLWNSFKSKFTSTVKSLWETVKSAFKSGIDAVVRFFSQLPSKIMNFVNNLKNSLVNGFKSMMTSAKSTAQSGISNVVSFFSSLPSKIMNFINNLKSQLVNGFKTMMSNAKSAISTGVQNMISAVKGFASTFLSAGKGLLESFTKGIKNGISKAVGAVKDGMAKVRDFLPFSPSKKGALRDLDKSGESFFPTWYEGALKKVSPMTRAIGGALGTMNRELEGGFGEVANFTGGRSKVIVTHVHQHSGQVAVQGDTGRETLQMVGSSMQQTTENDVLGGLRQAIRKR